LPGSPRQTRAVAPANQATLGSGPDANAAPGINAAPPAAGAGTVLPGSAFVAAHAQESVLDVGGPITEGQVLFFELV